MKRLILSLFLLPICLWGYAAVKFKVANYDMQVAQMTINERIANGTFEFIEGIWVNDKGVTFAIERFIDERLPETYRYRVIQIDGPADEIGMVRHFLEMTNFDGVYHITDENPFSDTFAEVYMVAGENEFAYYQPPVRTPRRFSRIFPMIDLTGEPTKQGTYGSGFALTEDGYIATCAHVSKSSDDILITGAGNDFTQFYRARIVAEDPYNDVAILKIDDEKFTTFGKIPYNIRETEPVDGEFCFSIGFPQSDILGYTPKIATGIVSTTHDTDPFLFQITVPIDHGNSGGALFDQKGNILGLTQGGYKGLYANLAVKPKYLWNLIRRCPELQHLQMTPAPEGRDMTEIVEINKPYVVLVFVNIGEEFSSVPNRTPYRFKDNIVRDMPVSDALSLYEQGEYGEAIKILNQEVEQNPKNTRAYNLRGSCWFKLGNYQNAYIDIQQAILYYDIKSGDKIEYATLYEKKAMVQIYLDNIEGALESIDNAIKNDPKNDLFLIDKGKILFRLQEYKKALAVLNKAVANPECHDPGYYIRGLVYEALGEKAKAKADMERAAQLGLEEARIWLSTH